MDDKERIPTIEDVGALSHRIEDKMNLIANTLRGVDKRMCVNLRYIASAIMLSESYQPGPKKNGFLKDNRLHPQNAMQPQSLEVKKRRI